MKTYTASEVYHSAGHKDILVYLKYETDIEFAEVIEMLERYYFNLMEITHNEPLAEEVLKLINKHKE